ncbi:MAG: hypothetical protein MJ001_08895 [Paludibacteraceae bacterium]|nr:hypothetical protein [Paludibacteraceae bacterium]
MAKPIRNTPILVGRDATNFIQMADNPSIDAERQRAEHLRIEDSLRKLDEFILSLR